MKGQGFQELKERKGYYKKVPLIRRKRNQY